MARRVIFDPSQQALAKAIRTERERAGFSQEAFALHAGLDRSYYSAVERGDFNVTLETMLRIAAGLGVSLGRICTRAGI
ncbi:MAG TPA: helix-turn-helix transcriptional regulator [Solirubrobacteraceae bacterium]|nr:helix-turn-helix transcriptional regulator [Solirubrobacteraceae bacterium]